MNNKRLLILGILTLSLVFVFSFAYAVQRIVMGPRNAVSGVAQAGNPDIIFIGENLNFTLYNAYPLSDAHGLNLDSYAFSVKNNDTKRVAYKIYMETKDGQDGIISDNFIKYNDGTSTKLLSSGEERNPTMDGFTSSKLIVEGTLAPGEINDYNLRLWVKESATTSDALNKTWEGKLTIVYYYALVPEPVNFATDSWETIADAVLGGNTDVYNIGDVKCVPLTGFTHTGNNGNGCTASNEFAVRIVNKDACPAGLASESACGFVLEFADIITTYNMNPSGRYNGIYFEHGWSVDGWPASSMYSYVNEVDENSSSGTIFKALPSDLQEVIIPTHVVSGHGKNDSNSERADGNFESDDMLYLLSPVEVYGNNPAPLNTTDNEVSRQLKYYAGGYELNGEEVSQITTENNGSTNKNTPIKKKNGSASYWWMRSSYSDSSDSFRTVNNDGTYGKASASGTGGPAPAFRIGLPPKKPEKLFPIESWKTIQNAVKTGNTSKYDIGDVKCVPLNGFTHTGDNGNGCTAENEFAVRIVNKDACPAGLDSESACGFVLEFADIITTHNMNPAGKLNGTSYTSGWNIGGWPASSMYSYVNEVAGNSSSGTIFKALPSDLQEVIIPTHVVSGYGRNDPNSKRQDGNWESDDMLYLLSPVEIYGNNPLPEDTSDNAVSRQLKYYAGGYELNGKETLQITTRNYGSSNKNTPIKKENGSAGWWCLRSAHTGYNYRFREVSEDASLRNNSAYSTGGVAPAFRIG